MRLWPLIPTCTPLYSLAQSGPCALVARCHGGSLRVLRERQEREGLCAVICACVRWSGAVVRGAVGRCGCGEGWLLHTDTCGNIASQDVGDIERRGGAPERDSTAMPRRVARRPRWRRPESRGDCNVEVGRSIQACAQQCWSHQRQLHDGWTDRCCTAAHRYNLQRCCTVWRVAMHSLYTHECQPCCTLQGVWRSEVQEREAGVCGHTTRWLRR